MAQIPMSISSSLHLTPRHVCVPTCLPDMTSSINVLRALQTQLVPFSGAPLSILSWDPGVTFIPQPDHLTSICKELVTYQFDPLCTFKFNIICHWDYCKSPNWLQHPPLFSPHCHQVCLSKTHVYLKICAYGTRRTQKCLEKFITPTSPQNGSLK